MWIIGVVVIAWWYWRRRSVMAIEGAPLPTYYQVVSSAYGYQLVKSEGPMNGTEGIPLDLYDDMGYVCDVWTTNYEIVYQTISEIDAQLYYDDVEDNEAFDDE